MTDRKTKLAAALFTGLFFLVCAFFSLGLLIPGAADTADGGTVPRLIQDGKISESWQDDFENWFSKHFAFRDVLVDGFSALKENLFRSGSDQVLVGRDGFLFSETTLDCYTGENPMTEEELTAAADALERLRDYAESRGAAFVFLPAPNKNTIYPEKMPALVPRAEREISDLDRLLSLLEERGVEVLDVRPLLLEAKNAGLLYHKRDSHWNNEGARIAAEAVVSSLGRKSLPLFLETPLTAVRKDFRGDLDSQLYPKTPRLDDEYVLSLEDLFRYASRYSSPMDLDIRTARDMDKVLYSRILVFRDSFANALIPYLSATFNEARYSRAVPFRIDDLEERPTELVLVEVAERNLRNLIGADERIGAPE